MGLILGRLRRYEHLPRRLKSDLSDGCIELVHYTCGTLYPSKILDLQKQEQMQFGGAPVVESVITCEGHGQWIRAPYLNLALGSRDYLNRDCCT